MFIINRSEQNVQYYWTGSNWTSKQDDAKQFESWADAKDEMNRVGMKYTWRVVSV